MDIRVLLNDYFHPYYVTIYVYTHFVSDPKSRRHRWAINQWLKAYTLLNNRSLIQEQVSKKALENLRVEDVEEKDDGEEEK